MKAEVIIYLTATREERDEERERERSSSKKSLALEFVFGNGCTKMGTACQFVDFFDLQRMLVRRAAQVTFSNTTYYCYYYITILRICIE